VELSVDLGGPPGRDTVAECQRRRRQPLGARFARGSKAQLDLALAVFDGRGRDVIVGIGMSRLRAQGRRDRDDMDRSFHCLLPDVIMLDAIRAPAPFARTVEPPPTRYWAMTTPCAVAALNSPMNG